MMLKFSGLALGLAAALSLAGCNTPEGQGAAGGAVIGGATGRAARRGHHQSARRRAARRRRRRRDRRHDRLRVGARRRIPAMRPPPRRCAEFYYDYYGRQRVPGLVLTAQRTRRVGRTVLARQRAGRRVLPSPNHGERRGFARPNSVVLHYTGMPTAEAAIALVAQPRGGGLEPLCRRGERARRPTRSRVAAGVACGGLLLARRARHELGVDRDRDLQRRPRRRPARFSRAQIEAVIALCRDIASRYEMRPERILAHSDIAPARKRDPGEKFPWARLPRRASGIGSRRRRRPRSSCCSRGQEGPPVRGLQTLLALYGYDLEASGVFDARTEAVVAAFQRHFRPARVDGARRRQHGRNVASAAGGSGAWPRRITSITMRSR